MTNLSVVCRLLCIIGLLGTVACNHPLKVKNLDDYSATVRLGEGPFGAKPTLGIMPFSGTPDDLWYFNSIVERIARDPGMGEVRTDYLAKLPVQRHFIPDLIIDVKPTVTYRSSGWNFLINWPGFLIFTPVWNGYVYRADVMTRFVIHHPDGDVADQFDVPMSYNLRHADGDRTVFTGLTWLEVSLLAFGGGIYNANNFDRDAIGPLHALVDDNYPTFVIAQAQNRIRTVAASVMTPPGETPMTQTDVPREDEDTSQQLEDVGSEAAPTETPRSEGSAGETTRPE